MFVAVVVAALSIAMPPRPGAKPEKGVTEVKVRKIGEVKPTSISAPPPVTALTGEHRILTILVETRDSPWPKGYEASRYHELLFDKSSSSVREYYRESSYGTFDFNGEVIGPVRVDGAMRDYTYDRQDPNGARVRVLIEKAVRAASKKVKLKDFDTHDTRGRKGKDGIIDHLLLVYAEQSGKFDGFSPIWPHRGSLDFEVDGVRVGGYLILNHGARLGVYVHELGHDLGIPDLYDRDYSSHGAGDWCTMASGSWMGEAERPVQMSAWAKIRLGWITPTVISKPVQGLKVPSSSERPFALKIPVGEIDSREYFLVENRRKVGFDAMIPAEGLLVWHIDEAKGDNDDERHKLVDVVEASKVQDLDAVDSFHRPNYDVDVFTGGGKNTLDDSTDPSARAYDGAPSKIRIKVQTPPERVMMVDIDRPEIFNPGGVPYTISEDGYTFGRFATVPTGKSSEALMQLEATPGGFLAFAAETFVIGPAGGTGSLTFRLYKDDRGKPGKVIVKQTVRPSIPPEGYAWATGKLGDTGKGVKLEAHEKFWLGVESDDGKTYVALNPFSTSKRARWRAKTSDKNLSDSFNFKEGKTPTSDYVARVSGFGYLSGSERPEELANEDDPLVVEIKPADVLSDKKEFAAAMKSYESILTRMEKDPKRYESWIPMVVNSIGVMAYELKKYDAALERFETSLRRALAANDEATAADVHENLGETSFFAKKYAEAKKHCERSKELNAKLKRLDRLVENEYWAGRALQEAGDKEQGGIRLAAAKAMLPRAFAKDAKEEAEWTKRIDLALDGSPEDAPGVAERTEVLNDEGSKKKQKATYTDLLQFLSDDTGE
jgi:M6 family metalloprotease-like protein